MTSVKHSESTLATIIENAKQQLEKMVDLNPHGMLLLDNFDQIIRANEQALEILSRESFPDLLGRSLDELFEHVPDAAEALKSLPKVARHSLELDVEVPGRGKRLLQITLIRANQEDDITVVMLDDLTEKRKAQDAEAERNRIEAVHALTGALQHTANQPLTVITVEAHLLLHQLEKGTLDDTALKHSLSHIVQLASDVAQTLKEAGKMRNFVTTQYVGNTDIIDIDESAKSPDAHSS